MILCLDFGLKRIGVAIGSTEATIAFPRDTLINDNFVLENLKLIIETENIEKILVGMPYKRDMSVGDIDPELQCFVELLKERFNLPVEMVDERYTSKIAESKLHDVGMKAKDQKSILDSTAAQVMLQEWLDLN